MKRQLINLFMLFALIGSTFLAPVDMALAAPDWTCNSVSVTTASQTTKNVTVTLNYAANSKELVDLVWGDGTPAQVIHPVNGGTYPTTASHSYGNAVGTFNIFLRVWGSNQPGDGFHGCGTTVSFAGCSPAGPDSIKLSTMTSGRNITATVSYQSAGPASLVWGDGITTTLQAGSWSEFVVTHHYTAGGTFVVKLITRSASGDPMVTCIAATGNTPSAVTLASMTASQPASAIDWIAIGFAVLGLVVFGPLALFAASKRS